MSELKILQLRFAVAKLGPEVLTYCRNCSDDDLRLVYLIEKNRASRHDANHEIGMLARSMLARIFVTAALQVARERNLHLD